ncbi:hypothetical protein QZH41_013235, partial [Actinostola sp. cb2023]
MSMRSDDLVVKSSKFDDRATGFPRAHDKPNEEWALAVGLETSFMTCFMDLCRDASKRSSCNSILLESMCRYAPRVTVTTLADFKNKNIDKAFVFSFKETEFIAVTAYMNKQVWLLSIA